MLAALLLAQAALGQTPPADRPQFMLLGSYHLANNHRDLVNTAVEDVLAPARQREIAAMVDDLARWKPTRIAIEWPATDQAGLDKRYADYRAGRLKLTANERDQIALRLAAKLNLPRVDAVDWNDEPPGPESAYRYDQWAKAHGQGARFAAFVARGQREADADAKAMRCTGVANWYRDLNSPERRIAYNRSYFDTARFGDAKENPGAAWVGTWYARNLRIFGNLRAVSRPGDRVLALYGVGHAYFLDLFARDSGAFTVVDPRDYLPPPTPPRC